MSKQWIATLVAGLVSVAASAQQDTALVLQDAWVRALPPTQSNTAAYVTVTNTADTAVTITGGSVDFANTVEIHTTREIDGYMRMEQLPGLTVAPGATVSLAPGGTHLMLLELSRMPVAGESTRICLDLASGDTACTDAAVRKSAQQGQTHTHHQHH
ncbi:MAG: copper chaperone PCu(A)C [Gammaproteobacteria bacterium]|nr:copper chaperone PCu(A)C [Gammaproteobacteria bacterium]